MAGSGEIRRPEAEVARRRRRLPEVVAESAEGGGRLRRRRRRQTRRRRRQRQMKWRKAEAAEAGKTSDGGGERVLRFVAPYSLTRGIDPASPRVTTALSITFSYLFTKHDT